MQKAGFTRTSLIILATAVLYACGGSDGSDGATGASGLNTLVSTTGEPAGLNCPSGGVRLDSGLDENRNGVLDSSEISNTRFVCNGAGVTGWLYPDYLESDAGTVNNAVVATSGSDTAIAVWRQWDGSRYNLFASHFSNANGWGEPESLESSDFGVATPALAMNQGGQAVVVWQQDDGTNLNIDASQFDPATGWTTPTTLDTASGNAFHPDVAIDSSGNALAVWQQNNGSRSDIWLNRLTASSWSTAELLESEDAGSAGYVDIAMDADGNAFAAWHYFDGSRSNIRANRFVPESGWLGVQPIEGDDDGDHFYPEVATGASGHAVVVWSRNFSGGRTIRSNFFDPESGWSGELKISADTTTLTSSRPQLSIDDNGRANAIWTMSIASRQDVRAGRFTPSQGWSAPQTIEINNAGSGIQLQITKAGDGGSVAVWSQHDGTRTAVWANRYVPGFGWADAQIIDRGEFNNDGPAVSGFTNGDAAAVWLQHDSSDTNLMASIFRH